ncbi:MAG: sigma-54-dependent Fis family transcriptional regulator [Bacillota bacterium]|nr:sigma-54-dependent Fis family transcriptional regulator [Bacillota bacterium]
MGSTLNPYFYAYNPQLLAYENAWVEYVRNGTKPLPGVINNNVLSSWDRCKSYGMRAIRKIEQKRLDPAELERRRLNNDYSMKIARSYISAALESLKEHDLMIDCLDADGYVLYSLRCNSKGIAEDAPDGDVGTRWSEDVVGTNAVSVAMDTKRSAQVVGAEHYLQQFHKSACSAAPYFDNNNNIIGIIRAIGPVEEYHKHTLGMVTSIVKAIENALFIQQMNDELKLSNERLTTLLSMITDGVVYYIDGVIETVNQEFCKLLDKRPEELIGKPISEIKTTPSIDKIERYNGDTSNNRILVVEGRNRSYQCLYDFEIVNEGESVGALLLITRTEEIQDMARRLTNSASATFGNIVYVSTEMGHQIEIAKKAAAFGTRILIEGESGTGKDLMAQAIHNHGARRYNSFVAINCGAIPKELFESEMFGYEKGAFTGARNEGKIGLLELADKGTVFLDEIGNMPLPMQAKLLRVLQEGALTKIGGTEKIKVDLCVIAATNSDLEASVRSGEFREDLYYRLNVVNIKIPPLRERREDIPVLLKHFLSADYSISSPKALAIDPDVMQALTMYDWPGNIRQLQNLIERFKIINDNGRITMDNLPELMRGHHDSGENKFSKITTMEALEKEYINYVLGICNGSITKASKILGLSRATIYKYKND